MLEDKTLSLISMDNIFMENIPFLFLASQLFDSIMQMFTSCIEQKKKTKTKKRQHLINTKYNF